MNGPITDEVEKTINSTSIFSFLRKCQNSPNTREPGHRRHGSRRAHAGNGGRACTSRVDHARRLARSARVHVRIDDGRNFLAVTDRTFDMITADPIHPRISGVGYLYTTEYYEAVRRRLRPAGVVCQWMPLYAISRQSFDVAFRSFAAVFPNASFWYVRGHGLFVASLEPFSIDYCQLEARMANAAVRDELRAIGIDSADALVAHMLMGPTDIRRYLAAAAGSELNTDDNAYLEYRTPFEYLSPMQDILAALLPFSRLDEGIVTGLPDRARETLRSRWNERRSAILPELSGKPF